MGMLRAGTSRPEGTVGRKGILKWLQQEIGEGEVFVGQPGQNINFF
jgi:hypothetical protein